MTARQGWDGMEGTRRVPHLKEVLGAMIFAANRPLPLREMRNCLVEVSQAVGEHTAVVGEATDDDIRAALRELSAELESRRSGFLLAEVAGGFRLQSDESCGVWLKQLLNLRKSSRLSQPSLETLAIVACRQPLTRSEIEGIRGVSVDHIVRALMELQLVRIVGRSELPGRPFLYGTTQAFLDHFGLRDLESLGNLTGLSLHAREIPAMPVAMDPAIAAAEGEPVALAVEGSGTEASEQKQADKGKGEEAVFDDEDGEPRDLEDERDKEREEHEEEDDEDLDDEDEDDEDEDDEDEDA